LTYFHPLSFSPKGERFLAPSLLGEGRDGGKILAKITAPAILRSVTIIVKNYTAGRQGFADLFCNAHIVKQISN
jgi:hypothetical protein